MSQLAQSPSPGEVEAFVGRVVTDLSAAFSGVLVNVGRRLGLYQAMADLGACTSTALAEATGIRERYVREWLANQAAGGYVVYDPGQQTYILPPAQAMVLVHEQSPVFMAPRSRSRPRSGSMKTGSSKPSARARASAGTRITIACSAAPRASFAPAIGRIW
jgi:hypothetical protein